MLSKYNFYKNNNRLEECVSVPIDELIGTLRLSGMSVESFNIAPGGTLGVFFVLIIDGKKKFVKTHRHTEECRRNLVKEAAIMKSLYSDILDVQLWTIGDGSEKQFFLIMDYLEIHKERYSEERILKLIAKEQDRLSVCAEKLPVNYFYEDVLKAVVNAKEILTREKLLRNRHLIDLIEQSIARDTGRYVNYESNNPIVCHGDYSNVNIAFTKDGEPVVLDWEDALIGFKEYDYLYWLTFYGQREICTSDLLKKREISPVFGTDVMAIIILIKSLLSFWNLSYKQNSLSIEDRLIELYMKMNIW